MLSSSLCDRPGFSLWDKRSSSTQCLRLHYVCLAGHELVQEKAMCPKHLPCKASTSRPLICTSVPLQTATASLLCSKKAELSTQPLLNLNPLRRWVLHRRGTPGPPLQNRAFPPHLHICAAADSHCFTSTPCCTSAHICRQVLHGKGEHCPVCPTCPTLQTTGTRHKVPLLPLPSFAHLCGCRQPLLHFDLLLHLCTHQRGHIFQGLPFCEEEGLAVYARRGERG